MSVRVEPRFTRDIDLAVAVEDDEAAERLVHGLVAKGFATPLVLQHEVTGRLSTVRVVPARRASELAVIDLLFASSGIEGEIAGDATELALSDDVCVPVAQTGHLIALKLLARDDERRPQDQLDLRALLAIATPDDLRRARAAVRLIERRGYSRERDLPALLKEAIAGFV